MSIPVTSRLDSSVVDAIDSAVAAGLAPNRGAVIARAVDEWLARHGEAAIVESYERTYGDFDAENNALVSALANFSVKACLAGDEA